MSYEALKDNGVLVLRYHHAICGTLALETFKELKLNPEVQLIQVSRGQPLAHYLRYSAKPYPLIHPKKEVYGSEPKKKYGKLCGVGVGPGATDLII